MGVQALFLLIAVWGMLAVGCCSPRQHYPYRVGPLLVNKEVITLGDISTDRLQTDTLWLYNPGHTAVSIEISPRFSKLACGARKLSVVPGRLVAWPLSFRLMKGEELGEVFEMLSFAIDGEPLAGCILPVRARVTEDFGNLTVEELRNAPVLSLKDSLRDLGRLRAGDSLISSFVLKNTGKSLLKVLKTEWDCGCIQAAPDRKEILPGDSSLLRVRLHTGFSDEEQRRSIRLYCNTPGKAVSEIVLLYITYK